MISKNIIKQIRSLERKKGRTEQGLFVAEGWKTVDELLVKGFPARYIIATDEYWHHHHQDVESRKDGALATTECHHVSDDELKRISFLQHPQQVMAVFKIPQTRHSSLPELASLAEKQLCMALDGVQDPGNLGTIIRIADWFGIDTIVCSPTTADAYNPKVVQATMGSLARVHIVYSDLQEYLRALNKDVPIYGTVLDGESIYGAELQQRGVIVMGNEGNGISEHIRNMLTHRLLIPSYRPDTAESLNVAIATAITCAEFRRPR